MVTHSRRNFIKMSGLFGALAWAGSAPAEPIQNSGPVRPKRLAPGQTIGLIAPASNTLENEEIQFAADVIRSLGFNVKMGEHLYKRNQYLAGTDRNRAADLNAMFADPSVDGIFALRGGFGSPRILPYVDYEAIAANPKVFMGYSDITALLSAIHRKTRLVTFHGPIAKQNFTGYTLSQFKRVLVRPQAKTVLGAPPPFEVSEGRVPRDHRLTRLFPGKARGQLIGGNLSILVKLIGTPYEPDYTGKILCLEDVREEPYRIDGMLTHLWLAGRLQKLKGIVFGKFTDCAPSSGNSFSLEEIFGDRCEELKIPALRGLMMGHIDDQAVLPIGMEVELDVEAGTLTLLEPAVV